MSQRKIFTASHFLDDKRGLKAVLKQSETLKSYKLNNRILRRMGYKMRLGTTVIKIK